jgi:ribosomal protein S18 acetylase RimI-like enzyme
MRIQDAPEFVRVQALTTRQHAELDTLTQLCRQHEPLELPLHLEPARAVPGDETSQILCYDGEVLIGCATLPPDDSVEVLGMVHPEHRRKGIGRALLEAVKAECRRRGLADFLLVCEGASLSGGAFAAALGGQYRFSEYRLELNPAALPDCLATTDRIVLACVGAESLETMVRLQAATFGIAEEEARGPLAYWLGEPGQRFYIGRIDDEAVGMLRVASFEEGAYTYINAFVVHPRYRGRGFGRQILMATLSELLAERRPHIRIEVNTENAAALSLYRSCGFEEVASYRYYQIEVGADPEAL